MGRVWQKSTVMNRIMRAEGCALRGFGKTINDYLQAPLKILKILRSAQNDKIMLVISCVMRAPSICWRLQIIIKLCGVYFA